jgi:hypothetical protein
MLVASNESCEDVPPQGATSPVFSAIGRAMRTSERKNLPGSSVIGTCAECSNQTRPVD